jgi:lysyl-tRNA synthetase class 2
MNSEDFQTINVNKLFNDVCGFRKKMKLEVPAPSLEDVKGWIEKLSEN